MTQAHKGSRVKVHYTGTFEDGTVFDTSVSGEPLEFVVGDGSMISGFDTAVTGMNLNDVKQITLTADEAYGEYEDDLVVEVSKSELPENFQAEEGIQVSLEDGEGNVLYAIIKEVKDDSIVLDANHQLAGRNLNFEIKLVEIQ